MEKKMKQKEEKKEKGMQPKRLGEGPLPVMARPEFDRKIKFKKIAELINGKSK